MTTLSTPLTLLRLEGAALLIAVTVAYAFAGASWWLYALLLLAPDLFALGYLGGPRLGAGLYNLGHHHVWGLALVLTGLIAGAPLPLALGLIWLAHIGLDRALGYGFKYPDRPSRTHLLDKGARQRRRAPLTGGA